MDSKATTAKETYKKGTDEVNYVVYKSTTGSGNDEVLQHKVLGTNETAHVTLHPDGTVNFRVERSREPLATIVRTGLIGYLPTPSQRVKDFLAKVKPKIGMV